jgi:hypothetical protein
MGVVNANSAQINPHCPCQGCHLLLESNSTARGCRSLFLHVVSTDVFPLRRRGLGKPSAVRAPASWPRLRWALFLESGLVLLSRSLCRNFKPTGGHPVPPHTFCTFATHWRPSPRALRAHTWPRRSPFGAHYPCAGPCHAPAAIFRLGGACGRERSAPDVNAVYSHTSPGCPVSAGLAGRRRKRQWRRMRRSSRNAVRRASCPLERGRRSREANRSEQGGAPGAAITTSAGGDVSTIHESGHVTKYVQCFFPKRLEKSSNLPHFGRFSHILRE